MPIEMTDHIPLRVAARSWSRTRLLASALFGLVVPVAPAAAAEPSFDCARAQSAAEKAVCASDGLAGLDRELARLYGLALDGPNITPERRRTLQATQRGWIRGRDDCWKVEAGPEACVTDSYAIRIHQIRRGYADARSRDEAGISLGPVVYHCEALVGAVFVNDDDPVVSLRWRDNRVVLPIARSGSGARYVRTDETGITTFWIKGDEAMFTLPGEETRSCQTEATARAATW